MIDQSLTNSSVNSVLDFETYKNKKSKMHESILIQHYPDQGFYIAHVYAIMIVDEKQGNYSTQVIDLRKRSKREQRTPLKVIANQKRGSLSVIRYFVKNPAEKKHEEKLKEKYPGKKLPRRRKYFPPLILLIAHYCDKFYYPQSLSEDENPLLIQESLLHFDDFIQDDIHQTLRSIGKPLYLKGEEILVDFHQIREVPEPILKKLLEEKSIGSTTKQQEYSMLVPVVKNMRKEISEQQPLFSSKTDPQAITHVLSTKNSFLPLNNERFPVIVIGEPEARRSLILNILRNANAKYLVFDPKENYGQLAMANPRVRGYLLGTNYMLNIISTEGEKIREQVYAYWFAKIIATVSGIRTDLSKTIETYLLGAYRDPSNQTRSVFQFKDFANQELTSEVTKMSRNESVTIANVLYPLGTYEEISLFTRIGRSLSFESLLDTKGSIIQFAKNDDQLTKIAYLFTLLKLRAIINDEPKIIVLENLDEIIGQNTRNWQDNNLSDLILGLSEDFHIVIGARSPSKIQELFKNTQAKFINRLQVMADKHLLTNEYNIPKKDIQNINKLSVREYLTLVPEFSSPNYIKVDFEPETKMKLEVDDLIKESNVRIIQSKDYLRNEGISPEVRKTIFDLIRILKEKPRKILPEEGIEKLLPDSSETDVLRAKEIARDESFIKIIVNSPDDSEEAINLLKLTERGEEYYKSYLNLKKEIPLISIKSLAVEKNFQNDMFAKLEKIDKMFDAGESIVAMDLMIEVAIRLLGALPEEDRFINGKIAAKLLDQWSYLTSLKEVGNVSKAKRIHQEFSQLVANALKSIKHRLLQETSQLEKKQSGKTRKRNKKEKSTDKTKSETPEEEFEFNFDLKKEQEVAEQIDPWGEQVEVSHKDDENDSLFLAAADDLKSAGLQHLDSKGSLFSPKKGNIFDEDLLETEKEEQTNETYDPFKPEDKETKTKNQKKQKKSLDQLKKKLLLEIAKKLGVPSLEDEDFIWHVLTSRFSGKTDDGYAISEIVTIHKQLYGDLEKGGVISENLLKKLEKLLTNPKLMPSGLVLDLKQYVKDQ